MYNKHHTRVFVCLYPVLAALIATQPGVPPFWGETEQQIFQSILKGKLDFESDPWPALSKEARDCVALMLTMVRALDQHTFDVLSRLPSATSHCKNTCTDMIDMHLFIPGPQEACHCRGDSSPPLDEGEWRGKRQATGQRHPVAHAQL